MSGGKTNNVPFAHLKTEHDYASLNNGNLSKIHQFGEIVHDVIHESDKKNDVMSFFIPQQVVISRNVVHEQRHYKKLCFIQRSWENSNFTMTTRPLTDQI